MKAIEFIKSKIDHSKLDTDELKDFLKKELFYLECNEDVAKYIQHVIKDVESKGVKINNINNSTVAYATGITDQSPKKFISRTPTVLPDFDYDTNARDEIKEYLVEKYGKDHVTLLGTVGTLKTKGALKDVIRQLRPRKILDEAGNVIKEYPPMSFDEVNELTKKFRLKPTDFKVEMDFYEGCIEADLTLKKWIEENPDVDEAVRLLLGNAKTTGIHAGGIVVSSANVNEKVSMTYDRDLQMWKTQPEMAYVEEAGLIKYDFLGLKTLDDLNRVLNLIKERHGVTYTLSNVPMEDKVVLELFVKGKTESVFQFNTNLATSILLKLKEVRSVEDLAMITSIARPGPLEMGMDKVFIERNTGRQPIEYLHPSLEPILKETYGILAYQESIIKIAQDIGHLDGDSSVDLMKSLSKKKLDKALKHKAKFEKQALKIMSPEKSEEIFNHMAAFALYGFNKSHAVAYACVSYLCMWFKHHYPAEWISAVLTGAEKDDFKILYPKWKDYVTKPDINTSKDKFNINEDNKVVMPFTALNGVGTKAVEQIIKCQPFESFQDFFQRVDKSKVNKSTTLNLIFAGVFDSFKPVPTITDNRWRKMLVLEYFKSKYALKKPAKTERESDEKFLKEVSMMNRGHMLMKEISLLNFTAFDYFEYYKDKMTDESRRRFGYEAIRPGKVAECKPGEIVVVGGFVESVEWKVTKKDKKEMCIIKLSNAGESVNVTVFSSALAQDDKSEQKLIRNLQEYMPVTIKGKVNSYNDVNGIILDDLNILL